jgi:hypothetical protein
LIDLEILTSENNVVAKRIVHSCQQYCSAWLYPTRAAQYCSILCHVPFQTFCIKSIFLRLRRWLSLFDMYNNGVTGEVILTGKVIPLELKRKENRSIVHKLCSSQEQDDIFL